jgi:hypothetical protein
MTQDDSGIFRVVVDTPATASGELPPQGDDEFEAQSGLLHALFQREAKDLDFDKVKEDWKQKLAQVDALADLANSSPNAKAGLKLSEIELGLTITAEGHLAFIAPASESCSRRTVMSTRAAKWHANDTKRLEACSRATVSRTSLE